MAATCGEARGDMGSGNYFASTTFKPVLEGATRDQGERTIDHVSGPIPHTGIAVFENVGAACAWWHPSHKGLLLPPPQQVL